MQVNKSTPQMLINRWMMQIGGYLVGVVVYLVYIFPLFTSSLSAYIAVAGSLIVFFAALAGLSFAFCSVLDDVPEDRQSSRNAGEKYFYATLCLGFSIGAGTGSLQLGALQLSHLLGLLVNILMYVLLACCVLFFSFGAGAVIHGNEWIIDLLLRRWEQRLKADAKPKES